MPKYVLLEEGRKRLGPLASTKKEFVAEFAVKEWIAEAIERGYETEEDIIRYTIDHGGALIGHDREKVRNLVHKHLQEMLRRDEIAAN